MTIKYVYGNVEYGTESDAQEAVAVKSVRMENNPTDWLLAKEIQGSAETGWVIGTETLTDEQILNPLEGKYYMCYCEEHGENFMPITASELSSKRDELRAEYAKRKSLDKIFRVEVMSDENPDLVTEIPTQIDMSQYLS